MQKKVIQHALSKNRYRPPERNNTRLTVPKIVSIGTRDVLYIKISDSECIG